MTALLGFRIKDFTVFMTGIALLFLLSFGSVHAQPSVVTPFFHTAIVEDVGPDMQHITLLASNDEGDQAIHVVRMDRTRSDIALKATLARDRVEGTESVLNQARRLHVSGETVVAGINADFFASSPVTGQPIGIHMEGGELVVSPNGRPIFGIDDEGTPFIREATFQGEVWREGTFDDELFARAAINEVNRPLTRLELVLYTPRLGTDTPPVNGTVVTLRGVEGTVQPGVVYTGHVVESDVLRGAGGVRARIPADGVVLAARGPAQVLLDELSPGEKVHFQLGFAEPLQRLQTAVAGWPILLEQGEFTQLDGSDTLVSSRHPRTAIGFNDRELFFVTVDGRQPGYADGMNLYELADLMLSLGATDALNLDGGGSTTMLVRPPGQFDPVVVNRPSDGHERTVANALLVVSNAAPGPLARLLPVPAMEPLGADTTRGASSSFLPGDTVFVLNGSRLPLTALGQDLFHGPVNVDAEALRWSVSGDAGSIDLGETPMPFFVAQREGTATVTARSGAATGFLSIEVVPPIDRLELWPDIVNLAAGETSALAVLGYDDEDRPVWLNPEQVEWTIVDDLIDGTNGVVSVDDFGRVTGMRAGEAFVRGRLGSAGIEATTAIVVDRAPMTISRFDEADAWFANAARARAVLTLMEPPRPLPTPVGSTGSGATAAKLEYDFSGADGATAAAYVQAVEPMPLTDRPTALGVWVHADDNEHWLRANVFDGEGTRHVVDFTAVGGVDWVGWRYVTAPLPSDIPLPITLERIYVAEMHRHRQGAGVLYFDRIQALYVSPDGTTPGEFEAAACRPDESGNTDDAHC